MDQYSSLEIGIRDKSLHVVLNRPERHNAFDLIMIKELTDVFQSAGFMDDLRAVVVTGNGRTFCAGADLDMMKAAAEYDYEQNVLEAENIYDLLKAVDSCPLPVIGRINGSAFGGGVGIISCCDIAVAVERAKFSFSEVRLGLVPAVISPFVIAKIGQSNARELFLTGERFDAFHAENIGLVHHVVDEDSLDSAVNERLDALKMAAPGAQALSKAIIKKAAAIQSAEIKDYLTDSIAGRRVSKEGRDGMKAFFGKRTPPWQEDSE